MAAPPRPQHANLQHTDSGGHFLDTLRAGNDAFKETPPPPPPRSSAVAAGESAGGGEGKGGGGGAQTTTADPPDAPVPPPVPPLRALLNSDSVIGDPDEVDTELKAQTDADREVLASKRWFILGPETPAYTRFWEPLQNVLILYSVLFIPVLVFFESFSDSRLPGSVVALITAIDAVFIVDLASGFFTYYREGKRQLLVVEPARVRRHYLRGWFAIDFVAAFPLGWILAAVGQTGGDAAKLGRVSRVSRIMRLMRLARITKIAKLSRVVDQVRLLARDKCFLSTSTYSLTPPLLVPAGPVSARLRAERRRHPAAQDALFPADPDAPGGLHLLRHLQLRARRNGRLRPRRRSHAPSGRGLGGRGGAAAGGTGRAVLGQVPQLAVRGGVPPRHD
jgi:hypothetical protein